MPAAVLRLGGTAGRPEIDRHGRGNRGAFVQPRAGRGPVGVERTGVFGACVAADRTER